MHDVDLVNFVRSHPNSAMATLVKTGVEYTSAQAPAPSDSYPGVLALVTGGSPKTAAVMYDEFYRSGGLAGECCRNVRQSRCRSQIQQSIDRDPTAVDGSGKRRR